MPSLYLRLKTYSAPGRFFVDEVKHIRVELARLWLLRTTARVKRKVLIRVESIVNLTSLRWSTVCSVFRTAKPSTILAPFQRFNIYSGTVPFILSLSLSLSLSLIMSPFTILPFSFAHNFGSASWSIGFKLAAHWARGKFEWVPLKYIRWQVRCITSAVFSPRDLISKSQVS